jgi:hypothetical protein
VPTLRDELRAEEAKLARMVKTKPSGPAAKIRAMTAELHATADRVKHLRMQHVKEAHEGAYRVAELRTAMKEQIQREREKEIHRKAMEPARRAVGLVRGYAHRELTGRSIRVENLTPEQGVELLELVEERIEHGLTGRKLRRYEALVGGLVDDVGAFERARRERETQERQEAEQAKARLDAMPLRRFEGKGGAYLPAYLFDWLAGTEEGSMSVADIGILGAVMLALEQGRSPFARSEVRDGVIVLDPATPFAFLPYMNPGGELGEPRVRDAVAFLAANDWLEVGTVNGRPSVALGDRRKLLGEATAPVT